MKGTRESIKEIMKKVVYIKNPQLADYMNKKGVWSKTSCLKKSSETLNKLTQEGFLEKVGERKAAFYKLKGTSGNGDLHALKVTGQLLQILLIHPNAKIVREPTLPFGRKPDAAVFIDEKQCQFFFLELELKNSIDYIEGKIKDYKNSQVSVKKWFSETYGIESKTFCFHLLFITQKRIDERPGVLVKRSFSESS